MMSIAKTWKARRSPDDGEGEREQPASRVGTELREARERLGWELAAIAAGLRIRLPYLQALEDGRIQELPGHAYAVMFLRSYAGALGLDADEAVRRFRAEAVLVNRRTELTFPAPVPERGVPAGALALLGILVALGAYAGWYHFTGDRQNLAQTVPPLPARLAPLAPAVTAPSPQVASVLPAPAPDDPPLPAPPPMPQVPPTQAAAAMPPPASALPAPATAAAPSATQVAASSATATPPVPGQSRITLRATANSWMQVREKQGGVLLNRVLRPGETWAVPADKAPLLLTTGNAGGTELLVDGVASPSLGNSGAVRRDLPLDADAIKDGKLAMAAPPSGGNPAARAPSQ